MTTENTQAPSPQQVRRIFTALLILGISGSGKTSLLATFAEYLWETYQEILLLYSWDGGAIPTQIQKRMHQGLIRFWRARTRSAPGLALETLAFATKGYWPRSIDPRTGETLPAVGLVAPITTKYHLSCGKAGHPITTVPNASLVKNSFCSQCKEMATLELSGNQLKVREEAYRTKGFEKIGGVAYDGLTSMCDVVLNNMDYLRGHGLIGGEKSSFGGLVQSGDTKYGGNNRADIGFAQTRAAEYVANTLSIPFLRESPVFTGLSTEGTDKGGLTVIGLDLPGQAALTQASAWFGNITEATTTVDEQGKTRYTLLVRPFVDGQNRRHLLKTSASPSLNSMPMMLVDPPVDENRPFTEFNLGVLFKRLDADLQAAMALQDLTGVPGMPDGLVEVGEAVKVDTPVADVSKTAPRPSVPAAPKPVAAPAGTLAPSSAAPATPAAPAAAKTPAATVPATSHATTPAAQPTAAPTVPVSGTPAVTAGAQTPQTVTPHRVAQPGARASVPPPPGMKPPARAPQK